MARQVTRIVRSSIPEEGRGFDAQGRVIQVGPVGAESVIVRQLDGTEQIVPTRQDVAAYILPLPVILPAQHLDALAVAQIAVFRVLSGSVYHGLDLAQFVDNGGVDSREFKLSTVFFDHPAQEQEAQPQITCTLHQGGFLPYDNPGLNTVILEETIDVFLKGTALRRTGTARVPILAEFRTSHNEERRGIRAGLERAFLTEPSDDREGRRVVVKEYFDQEARIQYKGQDQEDDSETAQSNRRLLAARFEVTLDTVQLVGTPELIESVSIGLNLDGSDC